MGKYDGINIVEAQASVGSTIQKKVKKPQHFKVFFINLAVCALIGLCIFSGKFLPIPRYDEFTSVIKSVVQFDMAKYIKTKVKL